MQRHCKANLQAVRVRPCIFSQASAPLAELWRAPLPAFLTTIRKQFCNTQCLARADWLNTQTIQPNRPMTTHAPTCMFVGAAHTNTVDAGTELFKFTAVSVFILEMFDKVGPLFPALNSKL